MPKKTSKWIRLFAVVLTALMLISACSGGGGDSGKIKIGILVPTSGPEAYYGTDMLQSYLLAIDEINEAGGIKGREIEYYQADDACDVSIASQAAAKIIAENPDYVVGGYCSGATIPALQLFYDEDLIMLVSSANSTEITKLGLNQTFMINSPGTHAIGNLSQLIGHLGVSKVAVIHQGDAYTKNLSDICDVTLPQDGYEIVTTQVMEKGAADVSAIVTAVRSSGAEIVYWCGYFSDGSNVIKQLRNGGYEGFICVGDGSSSPELITGSGAAGEGVYVTSPPFVEFVPGGQEFADNYQAKWNMPAGTYSNLSYDTIYVLKKAIENADSFEMPKVRDALQNIEYQGISGLIKFTEDRELAVSNFIILQIKDGAFTLVTLD